MMIKKDYDITKEKLILFPKIILDKLEEYRDKTGVSASAYIRQSLIKQMIIDKLIYFKTTYIKNNIKSDKK